jgi:FAD/FMN-containing dehydrogenase
MRQEHGEDVLALMWAIKQAYDPANILNPGKVLPVLENTPSIG